MEPTRNSSSRSGTLLTVFLFFGAFAIGDQSSCNSGRRSVWMCLISEMQHHLKSVHIFYTLQHKDLQRLTTILDYQGLKYDYTDDVFRFQRSVRRSLTRALSYSSPEAMMDHLNFIVICNTSCVHVILQMAQDTDREHGFSILLRHYSKWLIVVDRGDSRMQPIFISANTTTSFARTSFSDKMLLHNGTITTSNAGRLREMYNTDIWNGTKLNNMSTEADGIMLYRNITEDEFLDNVVILRRNDYKGDIECITTMVITPNGRELKTARLGKDALFPNLIFGMNGREFLVTTMEWAPFTMDRSDGDSLDFVGISRDLLDTLAQTFNFTYRFILPSDMSWGSMDENGNWDGVIRMLQTREADMCIAPYAINTERARVVSFGYLFNTEDVIIVYKKLADPIKPLMLLASAFKYQVYLCVSAVVIAAAMLLLCTEFWTHEFTGSGRWKTLKRALGAMFCVVTITLHQALMRVPTAASSRVLLCCFSLYSIIMTAVYTGNLMAALTVSIESVPFSTVQELAATTEYRVDVVGGTSTEVILQSSNMSLFKDLWEKVSLQRSQDVVLNSLEHLKYQKDKVFEGGYALITPYKLGREIMNLQCDVRSMKETVFPSYSGFIFPPGSPLPRILTDSTRTMVDTGLVDKWEKKWNSPSKTCATLKTVTKRSIGVSEISSIAVAAGTGVCIGILVLLCERRTYSMEDEPLDVL